MAPPWARSHRHRGRAKIMNDMSAQHIERNRLSEHYKDVQSFQAGRARQSRNFSRVAAGVAGILLLINLGQATAIFLMLPLARIVPVYLWVRPDGTIDSEVSMSRLPATHNEAVVDAMIWQYVRYREGYTADTARYAYDFISELSAPDVRQRYQEYFNYPNLSSPQVVIGRKGTLEVAHVSSSVIGTNIRQIRYRRALMLNGRQAVATTWTATVTYALADELPARQRLGNPIGMVITAYQSAEDSAPVVEGGQ